MAPSDPFASGAVIAGKYRIDHVLGEGAMGRVVAATHLDLEQRFALKFMLPPQGKVSDELVTRFFREARAVGRLKNEHVVRVYDVGRQDNGLPYLVLELLQGEDAAAYLHARGPLPTLEAVEIVKQACDGIAEAHCEGIIHRDIKPQNLFLCRREGRLFVKVVDFGISKITTPGAGTPEASLTKVPLGTPLYMAPEQLRSVGTVDARADVWALGATLYELLTDEPPFNAPSLGEIFLMIAQDQPVSPRERRSTIPFALEAIIMRCLEKNPDARFADAGALQKALVAFLASQSPTAQAFPIQKERVGARIPGDADVEPEGPTHLAPIPAQLAALPAPTNNSVLSAEPNTPRRLSLEAAETIGAPGSPIGVASAGGRSIVEAATPVANAANAPEALLATTLDQAPPTLASDTWGSGAPKGLRGLGVAALVLIGIGALAAGGYWVWGRSDVQGPAARPTYAPEASRVAPTDAANVEKVAPPIVAPADTDAMKVVASASAQARVTPPVVPSAPAPAAASSMAATPEASAPHIAAPVVPPVVQPPVVAPVVVPPPIVGTPPAPEPPHIGRGL